MKSDSPEEESDIADSVNYKPYHRLRQKKIKYPCHMVGGFSGLDIRSASKRGMPPRRKGENNVENSFLVTDNLPYMFSELQKPPLPSTLKIA